MTPQADTSIKIGVVTVPFITTDDHLRMALQAIQSMQSKHELVHIGIFNRVDNPAHREFMLGCYEFYVDNEENCLARAWNQGIAAALHYDCDFILIPNLDIVCRPDTIDNLVSFAIHNMEAVVWTGVAQPANGLLEPRDYSYQVDHRIMEDNYSFFMINRRTLKLVGCFDEHYKPAYCEDVDFQYRIQQLGLMTLATHMAKYIHHGSGSINKSADRAAMLKEVGPAKAREYYKKKWGGLDRDERFKTPFNKDLPLTYIGD